MKCIPNAIQEVAENKDLVKVFPNPFGLELHVTIQEGELCGMTIINLLGQKIYEIPESDFRSRNIYIPTGQFANGMYFLKAETKNKIFFLPIVKN